MFTDSSWDSANIWGVPSNWEFIEEWLKFKGPILAPKEEEVSTPSMKCPEIPSLERFDTDPGKVFWSKFPSKPLPKEAVTPIKVEKLEEYIQGSKDRLTGHQMLRAKKCIDNLRKGAPAYQKCYLPSVFTKNSGSVPKNGGLMTDTIGSWVKKGIVSGPFDAPPLEKFRVNPLMAVVQHGKIRPILNVSEPEGRSLNDNVDKDRLEKVFMSSARDFGDSLVKAGKGAVFSKFDLSDAYKNIPAKIVDLRLQGFSWLNKYFVEDKQIFGAAASVCNFDVLGHTVLDIAIAKSGIDKELVHRRLDDVPITGKTGSECCEKFSEIYKSICEDINLKMAPNCPNNDKAFTNQREGKVLGITFHSEDLSWSLPDEKKDRCLRVIHMVLGSSVVSLLDMQKLMGHLNDVAQMCPFMQVFKRPLNSDLGWLQNHTGRSIKLSDQSIKDLLTWAKMVSCASRLPIPSELGSPPLRYLHFTSDAAGVAENEENKGTGVGGIGLDEEGIIICCFQEFWEDKMITEKKDNKGARFGSKTSTLEMVGIIIPFLIMSSHLKNKHVVFKTDNIGCVFGWENKSVKEDNTASILVRAIAVMSVYLKCTVHVHHEKRKTSWEGSLADRLTRTRTTTRQDKSLLSACDNKKVPEFFRHWIDNPVEDWDLVDKCLSFVKTA